MPPKREWKVGDTFISPSGKWARFPEREMRVASVDPPNDEGVVWIDAVPVRHMESDEFVHCTYRIGPDGRVVTIYDDDPDPLAEDDEDDEELAEAIADVLEEIYESDEDDEDDDDATR